MYSKVKQDNGLAGSPFAMADNSAPIGGPNGGDGLFEATNSQFNPAGSALASVRYRLQQDLGNRRSFFDKDYWRYVVGVEGNFNIKDNSFISRFGYDSGFVYTRFDEQEIDRGDATRSGVTAGIVGLDTDGDNIPDTFFNPFIGQDAPTVGSAPIYNNTDSAAPNFRNGVPIGVGNYDNRTTSQAASYVGHSFFLERAFLYDAKVNMHLFPNLWNGGVDLAVGYEHREVNNKVIADPVQRAGDQLGFNAADDLENRQEVDSVFTELIVPIVTSTMNVPFVRSLELSLAWRYEKFTDTDLYATDPAKREASFDNVNEDENFGGTPRVSLRYQPIADITLRASWGQSFRSPLPGELFLPIIQDFPVIFDPYDGSTGQPPGAVNRQGNTALLPEKSDAYTAGIVWTPKFLPGFTMTADWYQIFTTDLILSGDNFAQVLVTTNQIAPFNTTNDCGRDNDIGIIRDPQDGTLFCVNSQTGNAGKRNVQGLDVTATYEIPTERFGKFTFSGGWNHFFTWKAQPGVGAFNSFLGNYNNGTIPLAPGAIPWNKGFLRSEWEWRHFDFVATGNYVGDFVDDVSFSRDQVLNGGPDFRGRRRLVPSYITLDMQLSYEFVKPAVEPMPTAKDSKDSKNVMQTAADTSSIWQRMLWGTKLTVGVNNAFDRNPPTVLGAFNDNYDTSLYTIRNRFWYVSLDKKF
jgi:iron complex outermembrane receptor protein